MSLNYVGLGSSSWTTYRALALDRSSCIFPRLSDGCEASCDTGYPEGFSETCISLSMGCSPSKLNHSCFCQLGRRVVTSLSIATEGVDRMVNIFRFGNVLQVIKVVVLAVTVLVVRFVGFWTGTDESREDEKSNPMVLGFVRSGQACEQVTILVSAGSEVISRVDVASVYFYSHISEIRHAVNAFVSWYTPPMFDAAAWSVVSRRDWVDRAVDVLPRFALDEKRYCGRGYFKFSCQCRSFPSLFRTVSDLFHLCFGEFCVHKEIHSIQTVSVP